ncbi:methyltransferase domain-containing protein [Sorangium sp. So ce281]|uniref:SAM-dependent methyltransferase n=1 Tax=unclassified Sorangium TaxID=2621164 RepID=UPI003F606312
MALSSHLLDRGHAALYVLSQRLVGADLARRACLDALDLRPGDRVLDIGCGPAYYFDRLPSVDYHGFDTDRRHIAAARARHGDRARFYDEPFGELHARALAPFDRVLMLGLLHHVDDEVASSLLSLVARSIRPSGRVITLDTALWEGQSSLARLIAKNDRGDYIRTPQAFRRLADRSFGRIEERFVGDTLRMPASHFMMSLEAPRVA